MDNGMVRLEADGQRVDIIIDRPAKRNAMNEAVLRDLTTAFETVRDGDARAVALLGEGAVLSAGMDLAMMRDRADATDDSFHGVFATLLETIESTPQPVVVGIKRAAPAGAFELTLPCDLRVLGADAKYGLLEVKLGTFPHGGGTQRLPRLVGLAKAKELVLTGTFIDPAAAKSCGLVTDVVPDDAVDATTRSLADDLATNAPLGMRHAKTALNAAQEMPLDEGLAFEQALGRELEDTQDYREGFQARLEDREPEFSGQ